MRSAERDFRESSHDVPADWRSGRRKASVIPQFLQLLLGYSSYEAGLVMGPRGIGAGIGSIVAGRMLSKVDGWLWMAQGAAVLGLSMFLLSGINLNISRGSRRRSVINSLPCSTGTLEFSFAKGNAS
jgi:hypothetical protein